MKLPYSWLKEYVNTKFSAEEIAEKLTMAGLEVDEVISGVNYSGVVVGRVESIDKHPNADKLRVAQVNVGGKDSLQIVCGAANLAEGQIVPVAVVGAKLGDFEIGKAKLRGVESHGMICSEKELGIGEDHSGIMVLENGAKIGESFISTKGADKVIDVSVLANRPDCMSIIGLAREVSSLTGEKFNVKAPKIKEIKSSETKRVEVKIEDKVLCPRYLSRVVTGVELRETPLWMQERLLAAGVRSIDLLVDISNYVMLEYGQPLHFFDLDKLTDSTVVVRKAKDGETIVTLDGIKRKLKSDNLVIANSKEPIAIAGVMGGATTEISKDTKNIFIEAAVFDKASIRKTSRALGLRSEAVARYEKGLALSTPEQAIERAAELLAELAGGAVLDVHTDSFSGSIKSKKITLNPSKLNAFLGSTFTDAQIRKVLTSLGFIVNIRTKYQYEVEVPSWRVDIDEAVDLYEEVARVIGFDQIPSTLPFGVSSLPKANDFYEFTKRVRKQLSGIGLTEIMTYSFASEEEVLSIGADPKKAFELANPLVKEQKYMRVSLVPKMLQALSANQFHRDNIAFFEIGKTFHKVGKGLPKEDSLLSIGVTGGNAWPISYKEGLEYYQVKGMLESLIQTASGKKILFARLEAAEYEAGRSAEVYLGGESIGTIGEISQGLGKQFGLKKTSAVAVINLEKLLSLSGDDKLYHEISKYQQSTRDVSFVVPDKVESFELLNALYDADKLLLSSEIVDIYTGKSLEPDKKSVTIRLVIGSFDHTLNEEEVEKVVGICQNRVEKLGGMVRGTAK